MSESEKPLHDSKPPRPSRFPLYALLALAGGAFLAGAWGQELWSSREGRVAVCAQGMLESGDWLVPRLAEGEPPRFEKPPLAYWLAAASGLVVGGGRVGELAAKLPSVLAALGVVLLVFSLGRRAMGSRRAGFFAALALCSTALFWDEAHAAAADMPMTFFVVLAVLGFWRVVEERRKGQLDRALPWLALGLGFLAKGPVAVAVPLAVLVVHLALRRRWRELLELLPSPPGLVLFVLAALPWYWLVMRRHPEALGLWLGESFGRADRASTSHAEPFYYYVAGPFWSVLLPWVALLPAMAVAALKRKRPLPPGLSLALAWTVGGLIFFSVFASKRQYYLLPLVPGFALAVGWVLDEFVEGRLPAAAAVLVRVPLGLLGALLAMLPFAAALAPGLVEKLRPGEWPAGLAIGTVPLICFAAIGAILVAMSLARAEGRWPLCESALVAAAALLVWVGLDVLPVFNARKSPRAFCTEVKARLVPGEVVVNVEASRFPLMAYYLGRARVRDLERKEFRSHLRLRGHPAGLGIAERRDLLRWMKEDGLSATIVVDSGGRRRSRVVLFAWPAQRKDGS
jgi:4-amino-4-deoxy-L-arabinose transferase-like glycosyltransferase